MASKKHEPQSLQKRLWRLGYAQVSFEHVRNTCDYILKTPISVESSMYYPLVTAIYTLYARPFSRSNIIGRWTEQIVPTEYRDLHEQMMLMRKPAHRPFGRRNISLGFFSFRQQCADPQNRRSLRDRNISGEARTYTRR